LEDLGFENKFFHSEGHNCYIIFVARLACSRWTGVYNQCGIGS
jgi:hypothetical protein